MTSSYSDPTGIHFTTYRKTYQEFGDPTEQLFISSGSYKWTNSISKGSGVPNWRKVIAEGGNASTGLAGMKTSIVPSRGVLFNSKTKKDGFFFIENSSTEISGDLLVIAPPAWEYTLGLTSADNQALSRYYSSCESIRSHFQGGVFLGELRETLHMIRNPAMALRRGIGSYLDTVKRRGRQATKRKTLSMVSDTWLEYAFGWRPLINDIASGLRELEDRIRPAFEMARGRGREIQVQNLGQFQLNYGGSLVFEYTLYRKEEVTVAYYGNVFAGTSGVPLSTRLGFTPQNFIPTLWELIPFSFLVDYFTNIGNIVSSSCYRSIRSRWTTQTIRQTISYEAVGFSCINPRESESVSAYFRILGQPGSARTERTQVTRNPDVDPGIPVLEFSVPGLTSQKWLNLAALGTSLASARKSLAR